MKLFVASLEHETNSFSPLPTNMESYKNMVLFRPWEGGEATGYDRCVDFVNLAEERGHDITRSIVAVAQPAGPTNKKDYEKLRDEILDDLQVAGKLDAVFLVLHGAQLAIGYDDCEGDLIDRVRKIVGQSVPICVQLDLHANITQKMVDSSTFMIACKEYPHIDYATRAKDLMDLAEKYNSKEIKPTTHLFRVPMLDIFHTSAEPIKSFLNKIDRLEDENDILSISLGHGFAWSDMPDSGASVVVITDANIEKAKKIAEQLGREFFSFRGTLKNKYLSINESLDKAILNKKTPVVIADGSDNPGGGAPGDSTYILDAMLKKGIKNAAIAMIWDPVSVNTAIAAGVGSVLPMRIGGKNSSVSGNPVDVSARVTSIGKDAAQRGLGGTAEPLGLTAAIEVNGIHIVLNSIRQQTFSPDCFSELGIDYHSKQILVVKSFHHFYAQFHPLASEIIYTNSPGTLNQNLKNLPYKRVKRPIWPLDDIDF